MTAALGSYSNQICGHEGRAIIGYALRFLVLLKLPGV